MDFWGTWILKHSKERPLIAPPPALQHTKQCTSPATFAGAKANKATIKLAIKKLYDIDTLKINTLIRPDGAKKAYARLTPDVEALDIAANKLSLV
ncbi:hypothetical protein PC129_g24718 [Phytophthora cactorum]|uniref:Uncharacterized protein n=1 Tax=Phytophthora cactorum TaxID=29920 RepID=A0A8T1GRF7_9STRA|nr:hypothetical protein PC129_g24718 [Phytophthora cactorum]